MRGNMNLPIEFTNKMKTMLEDEFPQFIESYNTPHYSALRLNPLKNTQHIIPLLESPVKWAKNGFYFNSEKTQLGKLPYHNMGLYYIQEPSAMLPAEVIDAKNNETILDLCASPGGKSTQIATGLKNAGLLISNEIVPKRANILKDNISRLGITNTIVLNETPENISRHFDRYFDKILVDAPCSGEGMFRKNPEVVNEWNENNVKMCATRQLNILNTIKNCLKNNGILVYSTCTFSPEENEQIIEQFLLENPDFSLVEIDNKYFSRGLVKNTKTNFKDIVKTVRIFPHKTNGEGHFVAKLQKNSDTEEFSTKLQKSSINKKSLQLWKSFESKFLKTPIKGTFLQFGENIYNVPDNCPSLDRLKVVYSGLYLGSIQNNRFIPSHELALSLSPETFIQSIEINESELEEYIHGNTLSTDLNISDWTLITYQNNPVGWGKTTNNTVKNHYPKYLRK